MVAPKRRFGSPTIAFARLAALAGLLSLGHVLAVGVAAEGRAHPVGAEACDDPSVQLCTPISKVEIDGAAGGMVVHFQANPAHCSSIIVHILLDGVERHVSPPLAGGQDTGDVDVGPVGAGTHEIGVQAEGVVGGCNAGGLGNWSGELRASIATLETPASGPSDPPAATPTPVAEPAADLGASGYVPLISGVLAAGLLGLVAVTALVLRRRR